MKSFLPVLSLASALLLGANAYACEGNSVVFEDQFKDDSGGWDLAEGLTYGSTGLSVDVGAEYKTLKELNSVFAVGEADICVDAAFPTQIESVPYVGLIFWAVDYNNFYLFQVSQVGKAEVWRLNNSKWFKVSETEVAAIKKDPGARNQLRITTKGNAFTAYINGEKVRDQRAQAPQGDTLFGFYLQTDEETSAVEARTFVVTNYKVTNLP